MQMAIELLKKLSKVIWQQMTLAKGGFKSEETGGFLSLQNKYSKSLSWAENLDFPPKSENNLFKLSAQDKAKIF